MEIFNRGRTPFSYRIESSAPWLVVERPRGQVEEQVRVGVRVDWGRVPAGGAEASLTVSGAGASVTVKAVAEKPSEREARKLRGFVEAGGYVAIDAEHHTRAVGSRDGRWAGAGSSGSGVRARG